MSKVTHNSRLEKRKLRKRKRKKLLFILIPFLLLIAAATVYGASLVNKAQQAVNESYEEDGREGNKSDRRPDNVDPSEDNVSILFIGVDDSEKRNNSEHALSDALILATLNKEDHSVKMVSIPRDSYVYVPEVGYKTKITHAHSYGGSNATMETVEELLDVPVDYFVRLNFNAFVDVIDALGGITVDVPYELYEQDSNDVKGAIHLLPGEQTLNGEEALALARTRKYDNDIERGKRQQQILKAIMDKVLSANSLLKYNSAIEAVGDNMSTNMKFDQMKSLLSYATSSDFDIDSFSLEGSDLWTDAYYWQLNEQDLVDKQQLLKDHLQLNQNDTSTNSNHSETATQAN
ncbi:LCP family protein [Aquibacillus sediminis]|uniref:LCP family protein n=1 Tax=Aquibacillus sediminis TaxID=2574734 RepID=UPI001108F5A4|nr:LCP family protein [Aquibacillus sediminis]